jgi:4-amino-4-deoxy-L-arabinose transferase-like glycosyltransferase
LKIGTVLAGLFTLPYMYLLGKELGSKRIGLLAVIFAGIAYWPNVIARFGLRFPLYPAFVSPVFYHLVRGLRTMKRRDFILAGIFLGVGLHGYSTYRIVPIIVVLGVGLFLLHRQSKNVRLPAIQGLIVIAFISMLVFLPLGKYALENPEMFSYRMMTRMTDLERELPGPAVQIFFENLKRALLMFNWDNGGVWVHSVVGRPALDVISGALFLLGVVMMLARYIRERHWLDLFLLISIPLLMLSSVLSLAFPDENPNLNRTGGALIPVFLIVGFALDGIFHAFIRWARENGRVIAWGLVIILIVVSSAANYDLVFNQYRNTFDQGAWNTSEMGGLARFFIDTFGSEETVWHVGYPHWADSRLVLINAGVVRDGAIRPDQIADTVSDDRAKMFLVNLQDFETVELLNLYYPDNIMWRYESRIETKDFFVFLIPPVYAESAAP